jgi:anti-anti-sigma regulatory factor
LDQAGEHPHPVLRLAGRLDPDGAPLVRAALDKLLATRPAGVIVDVAGLHAVDETCLPVFLVAAQHAVAWPGCPLVLCGGSVELAGMLARQAIDRMVPMYPDRRRALAEVSHPDAVARSTERLLPVPASPGVARWLAERACRRWKLDGIGPVAQLITTELVGNAVRHAGTPIDLTLTRSPAYLHIGVRDGSRSRPRRLPPGEPAGRGLMIIGAFASAWGCTATPDGKVVWATLPA